MRILLVEDDTHLASILDRALTAKGHEVDVIPTGHAAVTSASVHEYNAVILDRQLPDMDGVEVCRALRQRGNEVPILMLTVRDSLRERIEGLDAGADDYLGKPFEVDELFARLRAVTRRKPVFSDPVIAVGPLRVDTRAHSASRDGRAIELTRKEYLMLEILAQNAGRVVSRAELTEFVWDEHHDPLSNALEVTINRLRAKIDAADRPMIHTRRGAGYILSAD